MENIPVSKETRLKLVDLRNKHNFKNHNETIKELIDVIKYAETLSKENEKLKAQLNKGS